ncbi:MAG: 3'-5' exonuclease, partial [bacterium]|nr:3'-5' exonuclease [bacterium]
MAKSKKTVYCSLDIEGTGLDSRKDNIIEVGAVLFEIDDKGGLILGKEFSQLVKPEIPIPEFIQNLTGIREKDVADAPTWQEVLPGFKKFVGKHVILGQNIQFDLSFLAAAGLKFEQDSMDTKQLAGMFLPHAKFFNLEYLMRFVGEPLVSHHRALDDAKTTAKLLQKIIQSFHSLPFQLQTQVAELLEGSKAVYKELFKASKTISDSPVAPAPSVAVSGESYQATLFENEKKSVATTLPGKISECLSKAVTFDAAFIDIGLVPPGSDLAAFIAGKVANLAGGAVFAFESLENGLAELSGDWLVVEDPRNSICEVRLEELLARGKPSILLAEFLVKVLVWKEVTGGHSIRNLSLFGDDYNFRDLVCADFGACSKHAPQSACHVGKTIAEWKSGSKVLTTHAALLAFCQANPGQKFAST